MGGKTMYRTVWPIVVLGLLTNSAAASDLATMTWGAEQALKPTLVDPDSLQLQGLHSSVEKDGTTYLCGSFNARNRMGGYNGFAPFVAIFTPSWAIKLEIDRKSIRRDWTKCS
jgi:hypothetical protein